VTIKTNWRGIMPALSTPCDEEGKLDEESFRAEVRWNVEVGAHGVVPSIMSGEYWKFSEAERVKTYKIAVEETEKVPVIAGISHSGTVPATYLAKQAQQAGVDGLVLQPPYYDDDKTSTCIYEHYALIANKIDLPIMIQDTEGVGPYMCPSLYRDLANEFDNIVAVKTEGFRALERIREINKVMGDELAIIGGIE